MSWRTHNSTLLALAARLGKDSCLLCHLLVATGTAPSHPVEPSSVNPCGSPSDREVGAAQPRLDALLQPFPRSAGQCQARPHAGAPEANFQQDPAAAILQSLVS